MVVEASESIIIRYRMEYFSELLKKALSVKTGGANESIFSKKDVISFKCSIEVLCEEIEWFLFLSVQDNFDGILKINAHFMCLQIFRSFHLVSIFCHLIFRLDGKNLLHI